MILRNNSFFVLNIIRGFHKGSSCFEHSEVSNWKAYTIWLSPFSSQMSEAGVKKDVMGCYERQKASPNLIWTFQNHWDFNLFSSVWLVKIPAIFDSLGTVLLYNRQKISLTVYFLKQQITYYYLWGFLSFTIDLVLIICKENKNKKLKKKHKCRNPSQYKRDFPSHVEY